MLWAGYRVVPDFGQKSKAISFLSNVAISMESMTRKRARPAVVTRAISATLTENSSFFICYPREKKKVIDHFLVFLLPRSEDS